MYKKPNLATLLDNCSLLNFDFKADFMCHLPENRMIIANKDEKSICFCKTNGKSVEILEEKDMNEFLKADNGILNYCTNDKDKMYISDSYGHKIHMFDFEQNLIASYGSNGNNQNELNWPNGLFYNYGLIYICDSQNKRIQVISEDLQYHDTHELSFMPCKIQIVDKMACITEDRKGYIHFLSLPSFTPKYSYLRNEGRIVQSIRKLNVFTQFDHTSGILNFYNSDGTIQTTSTDHTWLFPEEIKYTIFTENGIKIIPVDDFNFVEDSDEDSDDDDDNDNDDEE